jgi:hypothetical protein
MAAAGPPQSLEPAGFGKITLLADWAQSTPRMVAWLSLDQGDKAHRKSGTAVDQTGRPGREPSRRSLTNQLHVVP